MNHTTGIEPEQLHALVARDAIQRVICDYIRGQDRLDPGIQRRAFHDDAYVDCGVFAGSPDDYVAFAQAALARYEASHHLIGQIDIEVDGPRASGEVYFLAWHRSGRGADAMDVFIAGRYIDAYEDRGSGWRIAARREIMDWGRKVPASDEFFRTNLQFHFGRRDGSDFSMRRDWPDHAVVYSTSGKER
jgi:hypothetical protein